MIRFRWLHDELTDEMPPVDDIGRVWLVCPECEKRFLQYHGHSNLGAFGRCTKCGYRGPEIKEPADG